MRESLKVLMREVVTPAYPMVVDSEILTRVTHLVFTLHDAGSEEVVFDLITTILHVAAFELWP